MTTIMAQTQYIVVHVNICRWQWLPTGTMAADATDNNELKSRSGIQHSTHENKKHNWTVLWHAEVTLQMSRQIRRYTTVQCRENVQDRCGSSSSTQLLHQQEHHNFNRRTRTGTPPSNSTGASTTDTNSCLLCIWTTSACRWTVLVHTNIATLLRQYCLPNNSLTALEISKNVWNAVT